MERSKTKESNNLLFTAILLDHTEMTVLNHEDLNHNRIEGVLIGLGARQTSWKNGSILGFPPCLHHFGPKLI